MFDQFNGMPMHVLLVHAAVVFVPLLALGAAVYACLPALRARIGWAVALLAVVAPVAALLARLSGEKFRERMIANGMQGSALEAVNAHGNYGIRTFWYTLGLGIVSLLLVLLASRRAGDRRLPTAVNVVLAVAVLALAAASGYYVFRTGDSGAAAVWGTGGA